MFIFKWFWVLSFLLVKLKHTYNLLMSKIENKPLASAIRIFEQYKALGASAMLQVPAEGFYWKPEPESNSIYLIVKHLRGNMQSRWSDFLSSDGEKPWRKRDEEFEEELLSEEDILNLWNQGWQVLFDTLNSLNESHLGDIIYIRGEAHSVLEAINRQIAHYSYHVGQIVYIAKAIKSNSWQSLSIPKNTSREFNSSMNQP
jgi:hypothetical protein